MVELFVPIVSVLAFFAVPIYWMKRRYDLQEKKTLRGNTSASNKELAFVENERKLLQARVENLESIICNADYELNQRIGRLAKQLSQVEKESTPSEIALAKTHHAETKPVNQSISHSPQDKPLLDIAEIINKRYRIQRLLGRGGMGDVYLANDEVLGEIIALKVISPRWGQDSEIGERFRREASAARKITSPNVIRIHDLGEAEGGFLYISMEYFPGNTLSEVLQTRGVLDEKQTQDIIGQICDGLKVAHMIGIVHRDLKPQNILVGERNSVKIIDFGLAKITHQNNMTATGVLLGTPLYMSPEQVKGRPIDIRSDIYSLAAMTYHAVTGRPPFTGENPIAIGFAHCNETPVTPIEIKGDIQPALSEMIMRSLSKLPSDRPESVDIFKSCLTA